MSLTREQIENRNNYIGGSDAAGILGLSRYQTPLSIWAIKTGIIEPEDISKELRIKLGHRLEEVVAELFEEETGKKVARKNDTIFHPEYPFIGANIDRRIVGENAILEIKTTSAWNAKEWDDEEIPIEYIIQVNHYMMVTGASHAYIAVLIGGNQGFKWMRIERDEEVLKAILEKELYFWNTFVIPKERPDLSNITYKDKSILSRLYNKVDNNSLQITLPGSVDSIVDSIKNMERDCKIIDNQIETEKSHLKAILGENCSGATNKYKITWKMQYRDSYTTKPSNSRVLRITDLKQQQ